MQVARGIPSMVELAVLLAALGCAFIAVRFFLRWRRPASTEPSCGCCGYAVRGLPTFVCPECGSDLREVGIVPAGQGKALGRGSIAALWTILLPLPAIVATQFLQLAAPRTETFRVARVIFCQFGHPDVTIRVEMRGQTTRWPWQANVPPACQTMRLRFDSPKGPDRDVALDKAESPVDFDQKALLAWLGTAGIKTDDPLLQAKLKDIMQCILETPTTKGNTLTQLGPDPSLNSTNTITAHPKYSYMDRTPCEAFLYAMAAFWLCVWGLGVVFILRRFRPKARTAPPLASP